MDTTVSFRWLGVAGLELIAHGHTLLIDPYFTRLPFRKLWLGTVEPDHALIADKIKGCDFVLITHAHFDHLMDVPDVVRNTDATVYGSPNACRLLDICGVPHDRIREIGAGDKLTLGEFKVEVSKAEHVRLPFYMPGSLSSHLKPPLRAQDYRMDDDFTFLITVNSYTLCTDPGERPVTNIEADVLFLFPLRASRYYKSLMTRVRAKVVIPLHWDDFFRPLSKPLRPQMKYPALAFPPIQRVDLARFSRMIEMLSPATKVFTPEIFRWYDLVEVLNR